MVNPKTTLAGILSIIYGAGLFAGIAIGQVESSQGTVAFMAITTGVGLLFARDAVKPDDDLPIMGGRSPG